MEKVTVSSVVCTDALSTWHCNFSVHNGLDVLIAVGASDNVVLASGS